MRVTFVPRVSLTPGVIVFCRTQIIQSRSLAFVRRRSFGHRHSHSFSFGRSIYLARIRSLLIAHSQLFAFVRAEAFARYFSHSFMRFRSLDPSHIRSHELARSQTLTFVQLSSLARSFAISFVHRGSLCRDSIIMLAGVVYGMLVENSLKQQAAREPVCFDARLAPGNLADDAYAYAVSHRYV